MFGLWPFALHGRREGAVTLFEPLAWAFVAGFVGFALAKKAGFAERDDEDEDA